MANAYWVDYLDRRGIARLQTLVARSESAARVAFAAIVNDASVDPPRTASIRLTRNGYTIDTAPRQVEETECQTTKNGR